MLLTWPELVPRVEITATSVSPLTGVEPSVTLMLVAAFAPVFPVAVCTRTGNPCGADVCVALKVAIAPDH
jgi:hypothetical protein